MSRDKVCRSKDEVDAVQAVALRRLPELRPERPAEARLTQRAVAHLVPPRPDNRQPREAAAINRPQTGFRARRLHPRREASASLRVRRALPM